MTEKTSIQIQFNVFQLASGARGKREISLGWESSLISTLDFSKGVSKDSFAISQN